MISHLLRLFSCLVYLSSFQAQASCYAAAAEKYGVPEGLIRAIAHVESGSIPAHVAMNVNRDGTKDIGRMQINSGWLPELGKYGITEERLKEECVSIHVGAWILSRNVSALGLSWDAVGAYNVGCKKLSKAECDERRNRYAWKVYRAFKSPAPGQVEKAAEFIQPARPVAQIGTVDLE